MKPIGGYFELELPPARDGFIHSDGIMVNSGRHALEYILRFLGSDVHKIWLPYYTCDVVLQPIIRLNLEFGFYHINDNLEVDEFPLLNDGEYIIVNNYFGIKDLYIHNTVIPHYRDKLIVDNAQAWYAPEYGEGCSFYSPRKFFGMPDGGVAYVAGSSKIELEQGNSFNRCAHLLKRIDISSESGYDDFRNASEKISHEPLLGMSNLSHRILASLDFKAIKEKRTSNFKVLHEVLGQSNMLSIPEIDSFECPLVYPYMTENIDLRKKLINNKIFVAKYWPNVLNWSTAESVSYKLTEYLMPLPIDQRYTENDMKRIIEIIFKS